MREQTPRRPHSSAIKSVTKLPAKHEATKVNSKKYFDQDEEESSSDDNDSEDDEDQADANQIDTYNDQVDSEEDDDDSDDDESNSEFSEEDEPVPVAKPQSKAKGASAVQFDSNVPLYKLLAQSKAASAVVDANAEPTHVRKRPQSKQRVDRSEGDDSDKEVRKRSKHAPVEMRSDRPVRRLRVDTDNKVKKFVDPRFADFTGKLDQRIFAKNYAFLEDYRQQEIDTMSKAVRKNKSKGMAGTDEMNQKLLTMKQQLKERQHAVRMMTKLDELKAAEREKVKAGVKKPFYLKNSAKKEMALEDKFKELKKDGKLKKYIDRKQHKQAAKSRKWIPSRRPDTA